MKKKYRLKVDDGTLNDHRIAGYYGAVWAERPEVAEAKFKKHISNSLRNHYNSKCKSVASKIMRERSFRVVEVPEGQWTPMSGL